MQDAIGRPSASFRADGLTTTTQQRIPQRRTAPLRLGGVCSPGRAASAAVRTGAGMTRRSAITWSILGRRSVPSSLSLRSTPLGLLGLTAPHGRTGWAFT
jgi:hypothetical protein